jgi:hypothetical protein
LFWCGKSLPASSQKGAFGGQIHRAWASPLALLSGNLPFYRRGSGPILRLPFWRARCLTARSLWTGVHQVHLEWTPSRSRRRTGACDACLPLSEREVDSEELARRSAAAEARHESEVIVRCKNSAAHPYNSHLDNVQLLSTQVRSLREYPRGPLRGPWHAPHAPEIAAALSGRCRGDHIEATSSFGGSAAAWNHSSFRDRIAAKYSSTPGGLTTYAETCSS